MMFFFIPMSHIPSHWQSQYELAFKQYNILRIQETNWENSFMLSGVPPCSRPVWGFSFSFFCRNLGHVNWFWHQTNAFLLNHTVKAHSCASCRSAQRGHHASLLEPAESMLNLKADFLLSLKVLLSIYGALNGISHNPKPHPLKLWNQAFIMLAKFTKRRLPF